MGNAASDKVPTSYSTDDPTKMQGDSWLQTYKHNPYAHTDRIPWGSKGSHLSIGVKVLQDMNNSQLYVQNTSGKKIYITKNGQQLPNAGELIKQGANYGLGPLVEITGPPTNPSMYMWTGQEMSEGNKYAAQKINSMADLEFAMTQDGASVTQKALDHAHSGMFGEASISGPFQNMPRDVWSAVGEENRVIGAVGSQLVVPVLADVVGNVIPGFGMITQVTGLQNDLQTVLNKTLGKAITNAKQKLQYKQTSDYQLGMSNLITDPRLNDYYMHSHVGYTNLSKQSQTHDPSILAMPNVTPQQKILKARALQNAASDMQADQNAQQLESVMAQTKIKYPHLDWAYYDQLESGMKLALTTSDKLNILDAFSNKLIGDVQNAQATQEATASQSTPSSPKKPDTSQPKGSGFQPLSWNPLVINGAFKHEHQQLVIRG